MQYEWSHWIQKAEFLPCYHFSILTMHIIILEPLVTKTRALNSKEIFTSTTTSGFSKASSWLWGSGLCGFGKEGDSASAFQVSPFHPWVRKLAKRQDLEYFRQVPNSPKTITSSGNSEIYDSSTYSKHYLRLIFFL